ncbi:YccF domain-containing protein [Roseateles sp. BYS87W]|uniref:Inner membrane protein YccF n=1 Tax=Pelomonas baiyunensis TaxID=3299026 RepID=A0ABW7GTM8_9BURK
MSAIGNLLWLLMGGFFMGLGWWAAGLVAVITVVGIPWAKACFVIGQFAFLPFGKEAISRKVLTQQDDVGTGGLGLLGNIVWFVFAGLWLALGHVASAVFCFITILGISFGIQHLKLAGLALAPIGQTIVSKEVARAARQQSAEAVVAELRQGR